MRRFSVLPGRVARLDRLFVRVQSGLRVTGATGHSGTVSGVVELVCDPAAYQQARKQFASVLDVQGVDTLCCDLRTRTFEEFLQHGVADAICPLIAPGDAPVQTSR